MERPMIEQVRSFNRTMTERVGVLNDHFLDRNQPLGEARLLWEIGEEGQAFGTCDVGSRSILLTSAACYAHLRNKACLG